MGNKPSLVPTLLALLLLMAAFSTSAAPPPSGSLTRTFSTYAGGNRSFYVTLPAGYTTSKSYRLVVVLAGTATTPLEMRNWYGLGWSSTALGLEKRMTDTFFIYPAQKYKWRGTKGWALGPYGGDYSGSHDIEFVDELLDWAQRNYSVDAGRVFVTGHSWGGDLATVVGCFLGDRFRAVAPVAANTPFWFGNPPNTSLCSGNPAVWTYFGLQDDYFGSASPNGEFGKQQNAFWMSRMACPGTFTETGETKRYTGCSNDLRLTLYATGQYSGGGSYRGHQPPDYFLSSTANWFMSF